MRRNEGIALIGTATLVQSASVGSQHAGAVGNDIKIVSDEVELETQRTSRYRSGT